MELIKKDDNPFEFPTLKYIMDIKELKLSIIEAGEKAVTQLIRVAKEDIIKYEAEDHRPSEAFWSVRRMLSYRAPAHD